MVRRLEKYEILDELGHGGMATVYRGRDSRLDRQVAVKVMHPHLRKTPEARERFTREARSVARLKHPNILEIYDNSDEDSDEAFIVTELLTGPTLKAFAEAQPIPAEIAAAMTLQIGSALSAAHQAGIIHRDVKPENVLLHEKRVLKLTDFGIAQMVDSQSFTATGQILGSPGHMAPEQVEGKDCDARTDLFSLGTVLYYLATGRLPFTGRNPHQILKRIVDGEYPDPLRVQPTIGGHLRRIIVKSLSVAPEDRYRSIGELESALREFLAESGVNDPESLLREFLSAPEETASALRSQVVVRLLEAGEKAAREGRVADASDLLNRVLALDEGNARALAAVDTLGAGSAKPTLLYLAGAAMGLFGLAAIALAAVGGGEPSDSETADGGRDADAAIASEDAGADAGSDAGVADAARVDSAPPQARARVVMAPVASGPRRVCFSPSPRNVDLALDGRAREPFGRDTRCRELRLGTHRVEVFGAEECCEPLVHTFQVVPGEGDQVVALRLQFRDARLYVRLTNPLSGSVSVEGGSTGATRSLIRVPMTTFLATRRFTVTAPGHQAYTGTVRLVAGRDQEEEVTLREAVALVPSEGEP